MPRDLALRYKRRRVAQRRERVDPATGRYPRTHWCGCPMDDDVVHLVRTEYQTVLPSDVQYCKSVWSCPVCGGIIRAARGREISEGVTNWMDAGHGVYLVTVTIRHSRSDSLKSLLDTLSDAWRRVVSGSVWQRLKAEWGLRGYTRTLEINYGPNGWHPHFHFLFYTDKAASDWVAAHMRSCVYQRFSDALLRAGASPGNVPDVRYGVDVQPVLTNGRVVSGYVSKLCTLAAEVTLSGVKSGRLPGHFDAFQLLDVSSSWAVAAWSEYVTATKGKRSIYFSRGLRDLLGLGRELDDSEVVDDAVRGDHDVVCAVSSSLYDRILSESRFRELADALSCVAAGDFAGASLHLSCSLSVTGSPGDGLCIPLLC